MAAEGSSSQVNVMAAGKGPLPISHQEILKKVRVNLVKGLNPKKLQNEMYREDLIDNDELVKLRSLERKEGAEFILECLNSSGSTGLNKFIQILQEVEYQTLAEELERTRSKKFPNQINIVLFGTTGVGKSGLGNSLLKRREAFKSKMSASSVTKECSLQTSKLFLRQKEVTLQVIDTPGLADTSITTHEVMHSIFQCMELAEGKVDIFMIVFNVAVRMTEDEKQSIKIFKDRFGEDSDKFLMIILTHTDRIPDSKNLTDWISDSPFLKEITTKYNNRVCGIGEGPNKDEDVENIYLKIAQLIEENNYEVYKDDLFQAAGETFEIETKRKEEGVRKEIKDEVRKVIKDEIREIKDEIRKEIKDEIRKEIKDEIRKEIKDKIRKEMETDYRMTHVERTSNPTPEDRSRSKESD